MDAPSSLMKHDKLPPLDKTLWDAAAYKEEWDGLKTLELTKTNTKLSI